MTDMEELVNKDKELKESLLLVYTETKNLFIEAEELFPEMRLFAAPTLEHRDALEHIMRYMNLISAGNITYATVKQLDSALGHEVRAYFDTADYVSISVRDEIRKSLQKIPTRKIKKNWDNYSNIRAEQIKISEQIANIRKQKSGDVELVKKYKTIIWEILNIYKKFVKTIEPQLRK